MDSPINLFKTPDGQARYLAAYDAALRLWPIPHESHFVVTSYGRTHIISCGPNDASPLVLLHAGQASSTMWFPNVAHLSRSFHVLAVDTVGEPGKSIPARPYASSRDCAAWLEGVLRAMDIDKTHVMGLSRGGWLALNLALYSPDLVDRIVLLSPAAAFIRLNRFFSAVVQATMRVPTRLVSRLALNSWVARGFAVNRVFAEQFTIGLQNWNWAVNRLGYSGIMPCTFSDEQLSQVSQPVLLLIGDQDRLNPPSAIERARRTIPRLEAGIVSPAGHFLSMERPESVDALVLKFLSEA
jgi:pimeloyl-ACP methyl ester carboxylesterase